MPHSPLFRPLKPRIEAIGLLMVLTLGLTLFASNADATPAFSRQTGENCATCHMQSYGPWLTEYGTKFKLDGYVAGDAAKIPTLLNNFSAEIVASVTNIDGPVPNGAQGGPLYSNNKYQSSSQSNVINDWDAIYYTGRVLPKVGSYLQLQISPQTGRQIFLAMADIRYADHVSYDGHNVQYGITANNAPTMSDTWMTSFAWMYPYNSPTASSVAVPQVAVPWLQTLMANPTSVGMTAYTKVDNHLYLEAGGYTNQSVVMGQGLGTSSFLGSNAQSIVGGAGYWRAYWEQLFGSHRLMVGTFGLTANTAPRVNQGANISVDGQNYSTAATGTNSIQEFNFDSNYAYMINDDNMFMAMWRYTRDNYNLGASAAAGLSSNNYNNLNQNMMMAMYTFKKTYSLSFMWTDTWGTSDQGLYGCGVGSNDSSITCSANGSPNTNAFLAQFDYVPFGKGTFTTDPYFNLRFSLQYTAYTEFNGAAQNYDGNGRSAGQNNTTYFVTNVAF